LTYTIDVSNSGPLNTAATVVDLFPSNTFDLIEWQCTSLDPYSTCTNSGIGSIQDGSVFLYQTGTVRYVVVAQISSSATGVIHNVANVTTYITERTPADNEAFDDTQLIPFADLVVTKTDNITSAAPGTWVTYTITTSNSGPSDAGTVCVVDQFPSILSQITWSCAASALATCGTTSITGNTLLSNPFIKAGGTVTYTIQAFILPSARYFFSLLFSFFLFFFSFSTTLPTTKLNKTEQKRGDLINQVAVSSNVTDAFANNDNATDTDSLTPQADVVVTKTDGSTVAIPG